MNSISAIAQSGLATATLRLNVAASNLANTDDASAVGAAGAYNPSQVVASAAPGGGVTARAVTTKPAQLLAYDPASTFANNQGLVDMPNIEPTTEVTNQFSAGLAFAYSLAALKAGNQEQQQTLNMTA